MTPRLLPAFCFGFIFIATGCSVLKNSPKYGFSEGYYESRLFHKKKKKVYVLPQEDTVKVYTAKSLQKQFVDTLSSLKIAFPPDRKPLQFEDYFFRKSTFDLDVLTIPFKYRPAVPSFPRQLNATFNGALYAGFRSDLYRLSYSQTPLRLFKRRITHFGYSFGAIGGIGTSRIDEYVTSNNIAIQYDGTVAFAGLNLLVGVETISIGLAVGADHLLDPNRKYWVNQGKPWFGVSFGLNLN